MNNMKTLLVSGSILFLLAGCGTNTSEEDTHTDDNAADVSELVEKDTEETEKTFTLIELSQYDGEDGDEAYVAVDGIVYDVTGVDAWAEGMHKQGLTAGNDHTEAISGSPHGKTVLDNLTVVGILAEE